MRNNLSKIVFTAFIAALLPIMPCYAANPSALVGYWLNKSSYYENDMMELFKDGTGVHNGNYISWKVENKRFILSTQCQAIVYDYQLSGSKLILTTYDNITITYIGVSKAEYNKNLAKVAAAQAAAEAAQAAENAIREQLRQDSIDAVEADEARRIQDSITAADSIAAAKAKKVRW